MAKGLETASLEKQYNKLLALKSALGIDKRKDVSESILLDIAKKQNEKEVFLLEYLIDKMKYLPSEIKERHKYLIKNELSENFKNIYAETETLYKMNSTFKNFHDEIYEELELNIPASRHYFNLMIYGICSKEIESKSVFSNKKPLLNLYLLQKWLEKLNFIPKCRLFSADKSIIKLLLDGYLPEEIVTLGIPDEEDKDKIKYKIEIELPQKYKADNITQVLAIYMYKS